jgi:hypothetical protein
MPYDKDLRDLIKATDMASYSLGEGIERQRKMLRTQREAREKCVVGKEVSSPAADGAVISS